MTTAIIVQARTTSTRLPGKVMLPLSGRSVLWHTLARCSAVDGVDTVCCAIPGAESAGGLVEEAEKAGAIVTRGPEHDVLTRYLIAADAVGADIIMRVTSDCPVIDPSICADVLAARASSNVDYACNNMPRGWPLGLDCEAFSRDALARASAATQEPADREHVTPWLRRELSVTRVHVPGPSTALAEQRWTLDTPADYRFFTALFERLPPPPHVAGTDEILDILAKHPHITEINTSSQAAVLAT